MVDRNVSSDSTDGNTVGSDSDSPVNSLLKDALGPLWGLSSLLEGSADPEQQLVADVLIAITERAYEKLEHALEPDDRPQ